MYTFPPIQRQELANGLTVLWIPDHEQEGFVVALQLPFGEFCDPTLYEGTVGITVNLMQKGTAALSSDAFAHKLEQTGAMLFAESADEHIVLGCKSLARFSNDVFELFWDMICSPRLDEKEFRRIKQEMITGLQSEITDANSCVNRHFFSFLCGKDHPAGRLHTVDSVKRIRLEHVKQCYTGHVAPQGSVLVIAGDIDPDALSKQWETKLLSWNTVRSGDGCIGALMPALEKTRIKCIDKADLTQTYLMVGHPVTGEFDSRRSAVSLGNYILGGGNFSSRLMAAVRSDEGKTYGISSQIMRNRNSGIFVISTTTQSSQTQDVLNTILTVYRSFAEHGVTTEELENAKRFAIGNMAFQLEGIENIVDKLLWLCLYNRDPSWVEKYDGMINALSLNEVNEALREHLYSPHVCITAVGDSEIILPQLSSFGEVTTAHFRDNP